MIKPSKRPALWFGALCTLSLLPGCSETRLTGPNFSMESPPWINPRVAQSDLQMEIGRRVILIGDAGLYLDDDPTLAALGKWSDAVADSSVIFLGDNIYDDGLVEAKRMEAERILAQQLSATTARKLVLPGNHDWGMKPREQNLAAILNQQVFIDDWPSGNAEFVPRDGCMGPEAVPLGTAGEHKPELVLIALDPTPFLTPHLREVCTKDTSDEAHFLALAQLLEKHADDHVILASHYPMLTGGPHGGFSYGFIGDLILSFYRMALGTLGDTYEPAYAHWIERTQQVMRRHPPLVYAAGHDHSLQVLDAGDAAGVYVVSGAGAPERVSTVTHIEQTLFAHAAPGFVVIDFEADTQRPRILLKVVENGSTAPAYQLELSQP